MTNPEKLFLHQNSRTRCRLRTPSPTGGATESLRRWATLATFALAAACTSSMPAFAADPAHPEEDRVILAGHPGAFDFATLEDVAITLDPDGNLYAWHIDGESGWQIRGGIHLPGADAVHTLDDELYVRSGGLWLRLEFGEQLTMSEVDDELSKMLDSTPSMVPNARHPFSTPVAATPIAVSSDGRSLVTDLGCISFDDLTISRCVDSSERTTGRQLENLLGVTETPDPTCESGIAYSVVAQLPDEHRVIVERSCRYPRPTLAHSYAGDSSWIVFFGRSVAGENSDEGTRYERAIRLDANLNPQQRVEFASAIDSPVGARLTCFSDMCDLDLPEDGRSYSWQSNEASAAASVTQYALYRSERGTITAGSGEVVLGTADQFVRITVTSEGGASICGWSPELTPRILTAHNGLLYVGADATSECNTSVGILASTIVVAD